MKSRNLEGRYVGSGVLYDDYSDEAYASNKTKISSHKLGCRLEHEKPYYWQMMSGECVTYNIFDNN